VIAGATNVKPLDGGPEFAELEVEFEEEGAGGEVAVLSIAKSRLWAAILAIGVDYT